MEGSQKPGPKPLEVDADALADEDDLRVSFFFTGNAEVADAPQELDRLDLDAFPKGEVSRAWIRVVHDAFGRPVQVPIMVARGARDGPVLGLTACLHGNEVQGVPAIHRLMRELAPFLQDLSGTVLGVLVANPYGYEDCSRGYVDSVDLNRVFPGHVSGNRSAQYAHRFLRIIRCMDYLIDLHTASIGRANTLYVRADMTNESCAIMARAQMSKIVLHTTGPDGSLRGTATDRMGIPAICVEMGDASVFQPEYIDCTVGGMWRTLEKLDMLPIQLEAEVVTSIDPPIHCSTSTWMYTQHGGLLHVHKSVNELVERGEVIASIVDIFGTVIAEYMSPFAGVVIGKSMNPVCVQGDRIIHLGTVAKASEPFAKPAPAQNPSPPMSPMVEREAH